MKSKGRIFAVTFIILMTIASTSFAYGKLYYDIRNDRIQIEVPDDWSLEEIDSSQSAGAFEQILHADNQSNSDYINLNMFFLPEESEDYIFIDDDKQGAFDYYEKYGKTVIKQFYSESESQKLISIGEPEFYDGELNGFLRVVVVANDTASGKEYEELIYLTAEDSMVHELLVFSSQSSEYEAVDIMEKTEPIAESFYDLGYGEELLGIGEESYDDYDSSAEGDTSGFSTGLISILVPIIIIAVAVAKIAAKVKAGRQGEASRRGQSGRYGEQSRQSGMKAQRARTSYSFGERLSGGNGTAGGNGAREIFKEKTRKRSEARFAGMSGGAKAPRSERPSELFAKRPGPSRERSKDYPDRHTDARPVARDAGTKYIECLRTLYKSGLLTKEELRQMIEKYENRR